MDVIKFNDVWEMYKIKFNLDGKITWEEFRALKGISFNVERGENIGIIGENGAGKSTVLKLIMGMLKPDKGQIQVSGKISGLLELGAGFQPELTGRENIYLNAGLFGLTQGQIKDKYEGMVRFADIGRFINAPVKYYSQGMFVRLAFAIAIHIDPDILLIDDTLAVGDEHFQRKCIKKIFELIEQGITIILVTHDMNMLKRICKRAIFIKAGEIIKDDSVEKVIPLYTQMVGEKRGVGALERGNLNLVFNNGRLFLNWIDKLITPNQGMHTAFMISDRWYSSLQADWEVKKQDGNILLAVGKFYQLEITQAWKLEIFDDYEIKVDIEITSEHPLEIREGCTNIVLTNEYTNWFTTLEKGEFPSIGHKNKDWQSLLQGNIFLRCIGVEEKNVSDGTIPSLIFKKDSHSSSTSAQIINTDYITNCRMLQYRTLRLQDYSVAQFKHIPYFSGKIVFGITDIQKYINNLQDEFILVNGKLKLIFDNGRCILNYNNTNLTKDSHISTAIYTDGRWYYSNLAYWNIRRQGEDKLIATGKWLNLPLTQIWQLKTVGESSFSWEVSMQVDKELEIEQQHFYVTAHKDYTHWFSKYGSGEFPDTFFDTHMDMMQRCIPDGDIGLLSQNSQYPSLCMKFSNEHHNFAKIFNADFYQKARILRIEKVEPEENIRFSSGSYPCFSLDISLDKVMRIPQNFSILQNKKLKFIFNNGSGRIFWDGKELTKRLGLYTSLRSQGRWHDSASTAIWETHKDDNVIKATGEWEKLPLRQSWEIKLSREGIIEFSIRMTLDETIEVDRLQTNLMLSEGYSQWVKGKERYLFPEFRADIDDDWDVIYSERNGLNYVCVVGEAQGESALPAVKLSPYGPVAGFCLHIVNSDVYHRGRVLQHLDFTRKVLPAAEYLYFYGRIMVNEENIDTAKL